MKKTYYQIPNTVLALLALVIMMELMMSQPALVSQSIRSLTSSNSYLTPNKINTEPLLDCKASKSKLKPEDLEHLNGRTIYFVGDSTIRQQFQRLCGMIGPELNILFMQDIHKAVPPITIRVDHLSSYVRQIPIEKREHYVYLCENKHFRAAFIGMNKHGWQTAGAVEEIYNQLVVHDSNTNQQHNTKPDVIYFNGALHFLHFLLMPWNGIETWHEAESVVNTFVDTVTGFLNPGGSLIYMRSHSICEAKYSGIYKDSVDKLNNNPDEFSQMCIEYTLKTTPSYRWDNSTMAIACRQAALTTDGVSRLNKRVEETLIAATKKNASLLVGCVDGFELTRNRCEDTGALDGMHYSPRVPFELKSLVESICTVSAELV